MKNTIYKLRYNKIDNNTLQADVPGKGWKIIIELDNNKKWYNVNLIMYNGNLRYGSGGPFPGDTSLGAIREASKLAKCLIKERLQLEKSWKTST